MLTTEALVQRIVQASVDALEGTGVRIYGTGALAYDPHCPTVTLGDDGRLCLKFELEKIGEPKPYAPH